MIIMLLTKKKLPFLSWFSIKAAIIKPVGHHSQTITESMRGFCDLKWNHTALSRPDSSYKELLKSVGKKFTDVVWLMILFLGTIMIRKI